MRERIWTRLGVLAIATLSFLLGGVVVVAMAYLLSGSDEDERAGTQLVELEAEGASPEGTAVGTAPRGRLVVEAITYRVSDAGTVTVEQVDGSVRVRAVTPAAGWSHEVGDDGDGEVSVRFDRPGRQVDFRAEVRQGRLVADVDEG